MAKKVSMYKMAKDNIAEKNYGKEDSFAKRANRYIKNSFERVGVDVNAVKKAGKYVVGSAEAKPGKVSDCLPMTDELEKSFAERFENEDFPTTYQMDDYEQAIKDIPQILTENNESVRRMVKDLKEFFEACSGMVMRGDIKKGYNKKVREMIDLLDSLSTLSKNLADEYRNNIIKMCTFNPFEQSSRDAYFAMVTRVCERYYSDKCDAFNEDDVVIIRFLRLEDKLEREIKRARADLFILSHMKKD